ncbi:MAG: hypothetical protein AAFR75_08530 [Pseudomonadota bacterium]
MRHRLVMVAVLFGSGAAGCAATLDPSSLTTGALQLPKLPMAIPQGFGSPVGSATDVYARVARGVLTCWLGPNGELKNTHLFHAVSQPERMGGLSQIAIYQRQKAKSRKRGAKAATITIEPFGGSANVSFENLRLDDKLADRFNANVHSWAAANEGCEPKGIKEGWEARPPVSVNNSPTSAKKAAIRQ